MLMENHLNNISRLCLDLKLSPQLTENRFPAEAQRRRERRKNFILCVLAALRQEIHRRVAVVAQAGLRQERDHDLLGPQVPGRFDYQALGFRNFHNPV